MINFRSASSLFNRKGLQSYNACNLWRVASFFPGWQHIFKTSKKHFGRDQGVELREDLVLSAFYSPFINVPCSCNCSCKTHLEISKFGYCNGFWERRMSPQLPSLSQRCLPKVSGVRGCMFQAGNDNNFLGKHLSAAQTDWYSLWWNEWWARPGTSLHQQQHHNLSPVVQRKDNAIQWMVASPVDWIIRPNQQLTPGLERTSSLP